MPLYNRLPWMFCQNILAINYDYLIQQGIKGLFFDLDNTIIPYNVEQIPSKTVSFLKSLEARFKVLILTNNSVSRTQKAANGQFNCVARAMKPFNKGLKEALELVELKRSEVVIIGDQLQSDIKLGQTNGIKSILVNPIDLKSEGFATKFNRFFENLYLKKLLKSNYDIYNHYFKDFKK